MKEIEKYFVINSFEDGWGVDEYSYDELLYDYCTEALFIPYEKIEELSMESYGLEIILCDLDLEDISEDWYVNLAKSSIDTSNSRFIA